MPKIVTRSFVVALVALFLISPLTVPITVDAKARGGAGAAANAKPTASITIGGAQTHTATTGDAIPAIQWKSTKGTKFKTHLMVNNPGLCNGVTDNQGWGQGGNTANGNFKLPNAPKAREGCVMTFVYTVTNRVGQTAVDRATIRYVAPKVTVPVVKPPVTGGNGGNGTSTNPGTGNNPSIELKITDGESTSSSSLVVEKGEEFTISGIPKNLSGLSNSTSGFTATWFFGSRLDGACTNNEMDSNNTWELTCIPNSAGPVSVFVEIERLGKTYKSNEIRVEIVETQTATPTISIARDTYQNTAPGEIINFGYSFANLNIPNNIEIELYSPVLGDIVENSFGDFGTTSANRNGSMLIPASTPAGEYRLAICDYNTDSPTTPGKPLCYNDRYFTIGGADPYSWVELKRTTSLTNNEGVGIYTFEVDVHAGPDADMYIEDVLPLFSQAHPMLGSFGFNLNIKNGDQKGFAGDVKRRIIETSATKVREDTNSIMYEVKKGTREHFTLEFRVSKNEQSNNLDEEVLVQLWPYRYSLNKDTPAQVIMNGEKVIDYNSNYTLIKPFSNGIFLEPIYESTTIDRAEFPGQSDKGIFEVGVGITALNSDVFIEDVVTHDINNWTKGFASGIQYAHMDSGASRNGTTTLYISETTADKNSSGKWVIKKGFTEQFTIRGEYYPNTSNAYLMEFSGVAYTTTDSSKDYRLLRTSIRTDAMFFSGRLAASGAPITPVAQGATGDKVTLVQAALKKAGLFNEEITGYFGSITKAAITAFQRENALDNIGAVGPKTAQLLNQVLAQ